MKLEDQVCTLEQAKRLKELGIEQKSLWYYVKWDASDFDGWFLGMECNKGFIHVYEDGEAETFDHSPFYSAFTVAELFVMNDEEFTVCENYCHDLAKRVAVRLITRLENNLIAAEEVNNRFLIFHKI